MNYIVEQRLPSDSEMAQHMSHLSADCQQVAAQKMKSRLLQTQEALTNHDVEAIIDDIDTSACPQVNSQIKQIERSLAPTTIIVRDL